MSTTSDKRSEEFLEISGQFKLGALVTESSHPVTADLSEVAKEDIAKALDLLFKVDEDVIAKYREFVESGRATQSRKPSCRRCATAERYFLPAAVRRGA